MYIQTKEPGAVSLWAFCILLFCCGQIEGVRSRGVENLLPDFIKEIIQAGGLMADIKKRQEG